jgi:lysine decarboxylase
VIAPYPPGIPLVVPGELITTHTVTALEEAARSGVRIAYAADPTLRSYQVVRAP